MQVTNGPDRSSEVLIDAFQIGIFEDKVQFPTISLCWLGFWVLKRGDHLGKGMLQDHVCCAKMCFLKRNVHRKPYFIFSH